MEEFNEILHLLTFLNQSESVAVPQFIFPTKTANNWERHILNRMCIISAQFQADSDKTSF